ncbi:hypothetical protein IMZ48_17460 [Candidatus Bathyarchaeota archaeon]|nr:hypothetical protein [Candidatus Bathyarchaeota archaeon]
MGVGRVEEVELAPGEVAELGFFGLRGSGLLGLHLREGGDGAQEGTVSAEHRGWVLWRWGPKLGC